MHVASHISPYSMQSLPCIVIRTMRIRTIQQKPKRQPNYTHVSAQNRLTEVSVHRHKGICQDEYRSASLNVHTEVVAHSWGSVDPPQTTLIVYMPCAWEYPERPSLVPHQHQTTVLPSCNACSRVKGVLQMELQSMLIKNLLSFLKRVADCSSHMYNSSLFSWKAGF